MLKRRRLLRRSTRSLLRNEECVAEENGVKHFLTFETYKRCRFGKVNEFGPLIYWARSVWVH